MIWTSKGRCPSVRFDDRLAASDTVLELGGLGSEIVVTQRLGLRFERVDTLDKRLEFFETLPLPDSKSFRKDGHGG